MLPLRLVLVLLVCSLATPVHAQVADRWTPLSAPTSFQAFIINPVDTNTIYATYYDGVAKSVDGGGNWTLISLWTADPARSIVLNPVNRDTLYMGVEAQGTGGRGIYRSTNRGNSWTQVYSSKSVRCVLIDSRRPHILYAGTVTNTYTGATVGLLVSTNSGTTWNTSNTGLTDLEIRSLALDPADTKIIYAGTESGVFKSNDGGTTWSASSAGLPGGSIIRALAVNPSKPAVLFLGTQGDGLFKSTDNGVTWFASGTGIANAVISSIAVHPTDPLTVYASVQTGAVFRTRDGGASWSAMDMTGVSPLGETVNLALNPLDPRIVYAIFSSGTTAAAIYKRLDPPAVAPTVTTTAASSVTSTGAKLNGTVNPNASATTAYFEWGTSSTLPTSSTTSSQTVGSGTAPASVSANLTGLTPGTTYYFRVVAQNNAGTQKGSILSFTTPAAIIPAAPSLLSPSDGVSNMSIRPTLSWNPSVGASSYRVQVSESSSFTTTIFDDSTITSTARQVGPLASNRTFYWRVSAKSTSGSGSFSNPRQFRTLAAPSYTKISVRSSFTSPGSRPIGLAWDGYNLWMLDNLNKLYKLDTAGNVRQQLSLNISSDARDLTWDGTGLWIGGYDGLGHLKIDSAGRRMDSLYVFYWWHSGIEWDGKFFWIGNYNNSVIHKNNRDGSEILNWSSGAIFGHPTGISYDGINLWVGTSAEGFTKDIFKFSTTGQTLFKADLTPLGLNPTAGSFASVAWDGQSLWYASDDQFKIFRLNVPYYHQPPPVPALVSPADGATGQSTSVSFTWQESLDASSYRLQIASSSTFATLMFDDSTITSTTASVSGLAGGTAFYWRVRAKNSAGWSNYSPVWSFTTTGTTSLPVKVTDFSPRSGPVGTSVTITGTNFSTTPAENIVWFGAVRATVTAATSSSLTVKVPTGATYAPIAVTVKGLTAYFSSPFVVTYAGGGSISGSSFAPAVDFNAGSFPWGLIVCDFDRDGKADVATTNWGDTAVSVFRNRSTTGVINSSSFEPKVDFISGGPPGSIAVGDFDGDGKPDVAVANQGSSTLSTLKNLSNVGSITAGSFGMRADFTEVNGASFIVVADLDGDGKPDLIAANYFGSSVSVFRNTSTTASPSTGSFAFPLSYAAGVNPWAVAAGDLDGDGKPEIVVANQNSNTISILRNTSTSGNISFAARVDLSIDKPNTIAIGDLDGDSKPEIAVTSWNGFAGVFRNKSTSGTITASSFEPHVDLMAGSEPGSVCMGDLNGDGKVDLAVSNLRGNTVSVFQNNAASSAAGISFSPKIDFAVGLDPQHVAIGDLDGDGKPDLVVSNNRGSTISVLRNKLGEGGAPIVATSAAVVTSPTSATLNGTVNPNGLPTTATFEWGMSSTLTPSSTTPIQSIGSGTADVSVSANLTGLTTGTTYYFRAIGENNAGTQKGGVFSFTPLSTGVDQYEPNNTAAKATSISYGFASSGADLSPAGDVDYFKFTASTGDFILVEAVTDEASGLDARISLFDAAGNELASSDIVSTGTERILYGAKRAEQLFIRVVEASDTAHFPNESDGGGAAPELKISKLARSTLSGSALATPAYTLSLSKGSPLPPLALGAGAGFNGLVPLRWVQPPSNPPVAYRIYRSTAAAGPFDLIGTTWRESYVDTTAVNATLYHYYVKSVYGATNAESEPSNVDKATPRALGFKLPSRFATAKPTIDGTIRATEWSEAQADNIAIRRTAAEPPSVTVLMKNDASTLYVGVIDSNASASTWNRLVLAFDGDNNKTWNKALPPNEGLLVIDDSAGTALTEFYGVAGDFPDIEVMDAVRNPKGIVARLSRQGSSLHYEISIDLTSVAPVAGASASLGMYISVVSDEFNGEYPLQAIAYAPATFGDVILARLSTAATLVSPLNGSLGITVNPTLNWNPVTAATGYRLQVATDSNFVSGILLDQSNITGTSRSLSGLANGSDHYWRVMASVSGNAGTWSSTWRFKTILGTVSLSSPTDKSTGVSASPTLSWNAVKGAASYHLQVSLTSSFATTGVDQPGIANTTFSASGLRADTIYYWRVEAVDAGGSGGWSTTWSFRTLGSTPSAPALSAPANNASNQATTLTLSWAAAGGATAYYLQVGLNSSFTSGLAVVDSTLTTTSKQLSSLAENTTYYWRVRGRNAGGYGPWSSTYAFTTVATKTVTSAPVTFPSNPTAATDYRLVTFPTISSPKFGDLLPGSQYTTWRIWEENGGAVPNNLNEASAISTANLGMGYWLLYKGTYTYSRAGMMPQLEADGTCIISVNQGVWNIIGNPFDVAVSWSAVKQRNSTSANLWTYSGTSGFQQSTTLEPFKGYYFYSNTTALRIPFPFPATKVTESPPPAVDWRIQVVLQTELNEDAQNFVGIAPQSSQSADELDQEEPPVPFEQGGLSILRQNNGNQRELLSADFRPSIGEGQVWHFEVTNPKRTYGRLRVLGIESLPPGLEIRLIGSGGTGNTDLRKITDIPLQTGSEKSWFSLLVGTKSFVDQEEAQLVPKNFELFQNYPNPFNPATAISYQLSAVSHVRLGVYDALGRQVALLVDAEQPAGRYQVTFDAKELTSGVYFYRMQAQPISGGASNTFVNTRKLVVVK